MTRETENLSTSGSLDANDPQLVINGFPINYRIVDHLDQEKNPLAIEVEDVHNLDEINQAAIDALQRKCWFLLPEYATQTIRQRFDIQLCDGINVGLYNFQDKDLNLEEISRLGRTLARYYDSLRDKSLWMLDSIQIEREDTQNPKNGEPYRGQEVPAQKRFKLFPASFAQGHYRGIIDCSWLEGAAIHETTHVTVESRLRSLWEQKLDVLGWRSSEYVLIELPGGHTTTRYNEFPSRCPTPYASYQEDDDRAESVVLHLAEPGKLEETRSQIVSKVFNLPNPAINVPIITQQPDGLPKLNIVNVSIVKKPDVSSFFTLLGSVRRGTPKPIVSLEIFRKQRNLG